MIEGDSLNHDKFKELIDNSYLEASIVKRFDNPYMEGIYRFWKEGFSLGNQLDDHVPCFDRYMILYIPHQFEKYCQLTLFISKTS